jgi:hypothetical protein
MVSFAGMAELAALLELLEEPELLDELPEPLSCASSVGEMTDVDIANPYWWFAGATLPAY